MPTMQDLADELRAREGGAIIRALQDEADRDEDTLVSFFTAVYPDARARLVGNPGIISPSRFQALMIAQHNALDEAMKAVRRYHDEQGGKAIECRAEGCDACCYQHVMVTTPEAIAIAIDIMHRHHRRSAEIERIRREVGNMAALVADKDVTERFNLRKPCALLVDRKCSVYAVRPSICRSYFSATRDACFGPAGSRVAILNLAQTAAQAILFAFDVAALERGLQMEMIELQDAVAQALDERFIRAWLAGERVFKGADGVYPTVLRAAKGRYWRGKGAAR